MAIYGGVGYGPQRNALDRGVDIVVACPGRLEDLVAQRAVNLVDVRVVVVDEADRMADMGFLPAVKRLLDVTPSERQTLLFSATLDGAVDVLVRRYQHEPRRHEITDDEGEPGDGPPPVLEDRHRPTGSRSPPTSWPAMARPSSSAGRSTAPTASSSSSAAPVCRPWPSTANRSQPQRERALQQFSSGAARALVATDVAARGIHVDARRLRRPLRSARRPQGLRAPLRAHRPGRRRRHRRLARPARAGPRRRGCCSGRSGWRRASSPPTSSCSATACR